jgi:hypothetical protein
LGGNLGLVWCGRTGIGVFLAVWGEKGGNLRSVGVLLVFVCLPSGWLERGLFWEFLEKNRKF